MLLQSLDKQHVIRVEENLSLDFLGSNLGTENEYIIKNSKTGKILYHDLNMTVLGGRISILEECFGLDQDPTLRITLNNIMGIEHSETNKVFEQKIRRPTCYFMVGDGAKSLSVPGKICKPRNYETKIYNPIPFRCVPVTSDIPSSEQDKYGLKKVISIGGIDHYAYFAKAFTISKIFVQYNGTTYVPVEDHTVPIPQDDNSHPLSGGSVKVFISFSLDIDASECKEYFKLKYGTLDGCSLNETGLVKAAKLINNAVGSPTNGKYELAGAELFAKLTSSSQPIDETTSRTVKYKIYAK